MLRMVDVEFIKLRARDGWSVREIARRTGWSRQTIRKVLAAPVAPPRYALSVPRRSPVMEPYLAVVERWLAEDEEAPPKQRHTARRIYDRLVEEHSFPGAETTVRQAVARRRGSRHEVVLSEPGSWQQFVGSLIATGDGPVRASDEPGARTAVRRPSSARCGGPPPQLNVDVRVTTDLDLRSAAHDPHCRRSRAWGRLPAGEAALG